MRCGDKIVLDFTGHPVRGFRNLPLTISSKVETFRIEQWCREDDRIGFSDIVARMFTKITDTGREPFRKRTNLASQTRYFRNRKGLKSWSDRAGSQAHNAYLDSLRTPYQRLHNLTIERDLTAAEESHLSTLNERQTVHKPSTLRRKAIGKVQRRTAVAPKAVRRTRTHTDKGSSGEESEVENAPNDEVDDPEDYRQKRPMTLEDAVELRSALDGAIQTFSNFTGNAPESLNFNASYAVQHSQIQDQLVRFWMETEFGFRAPNLPRHARWTGGFDQWRAAHIFDIL